MLRLDVRSLALAIVLQSGSLAMAGDRWPEFRGPTAQGRADDTGLPVQWSNTENVAWKTPLPGSGWSSPVLQDGRIYLTAAVPVEGSENKDLSLRTLCLDAATGEIVWNEEVFLQNGKGAPAIHGKNSHASPTPILADGRLYVHFGHQGTACLNLEGKPVWRNSNFFYEPVHGNGGSPALVGSYLIYSADGASQQIVRALHRDTGEEVWKSDRQTDAPKKFAFATPLAIEAGGRRQVISQGANALCSYDPETGAELWRVTYDGYSCIPRPVFGHGLLFVSTGYDSPVLLAIRPDGSGDVTQTHVAWRYAKGAPHTPSPLLVGDELYLVSDRGVATCLDAKTGDVHWEKRIGGNFSASPVYADGHVYLQSEEGVATVLAAGKEYELLGTNKMEERTLASYAVAFGALFIRTDKHLYRIQASR